MPPRKRKRLKPGERVTLSLALAEVDLIVEHAMLSEGLLATIHAARVRDDTVRVRCTLGELRELAGCVAAEARGMKNGELQKALGAISEAIATVEQAHYYEPSPHNKRLKLVRIEND